MGTAKFNVYSWRDIMRICGGVASTSSKDKIICQYIDLCFKTVECVAYGSNAYQVSRVSVPCEIKDLPDGYHLLIKPMKIPSGTKFVEIHIDQANKKFDIAFIDADDDIRDAAVCEFFDGDPMDYEMFYKRSHESIDKYGHGEGKYCISVNPRYLITALEGLKSCDHVILNFADRTDAFSIRPWDDSIDAEALVLPVRRL